jgi:hypothetical protein
MQIDIYTLCTEYKATHVGIFRCIRYFSILSLSTSQINLLVNSL